VYKRKAEGGKRGGLANLDIVMFFTTVFTTADWLTLTLSCLHANARALALCSDNIRKDAGYKRDHITAAPRRHAVCGHGEVVAGDTPAQRDMSR
jgi:hypothetical protein